MAITWGTIKREVKQEQFPNQAVITLEAYKGKGHGNRMSFNPKSIELLATTPGLSKVYFATDDESKEVYIGKVDSEDAIMMTKSMSISNKKFYDWIIKNYELDNSKDNFMALTDSVNLGDSIVYKMVPLNTNNEEIITPGPIEDTETAYIEEDEASDYAVLGEEECVPKFSAFKESIPHGYIDY